MEVASEREIHIKFCGNGKNSRGTVKFSESRK